MAIIESKIKVYSGDTPSPATIIGTVTTASDEAQIYIDSERLNGEIAAASQYTAVANCTNSNGVQSPDSAPYTFYTLTDSYLSGVSEISTDEGDYIYTRVYHSEGDGSVAVEKIGVDWTKNEDYSNPIRIYGDASGDVYIQITRDMRGNDIAILPFVEDKPLTSSATRFCQRDWDDWANYIYIKYSAPELIVDPWTFQADNDRIMIYPFTTEPSGETYDYAWLWIKNITRVGEPYYKIRVHRMLKGEEIAFINGEQDYYHNTINIYPDEQYQIEIYTAETQTMKGMTYKTTIYTPEEDYADVYIDSIDPDTNSAMIDVYIVTNRTISSAILYYKDSFGQIYIPIRLRMENGTQSVTIAGLSSLTQYDVQLVVEFYDGDPITDKGSFTTL